MWRWVVVLATATACGPRSSEPPDEPDAPDEPDPPLLACPGERDPRFDALAAVIDAERQALGVPGVAVAVVLDGGIAWCEGFGARGPGSPEPMGARSLLRIGSVTKALTATALLQEVERGNLDLDATVPEVLGPDWSFALDASWADQMKVEHLLTHEGGFYDYLEIDADRGAGALSDWVDGWMLDNLFLMAPPGSFFNYSNPNYMVAGRLVEHSSGQGYVPRMGELFDELGMTRSFFRASDVLDDGDYATGDTLDWETGAQRVEVEPQDYDNAWARPAGYAWSSVEDLARFSDFLMRDSGSVLSSPLRLEMRTPQVFMGGIPDLTHYGYGLMVHEGVFLDDGFHPVRWISHSGAIPGYSAELHAFPEQGFALVTLANGDGAYFVDALVEALSTLVALPDTSEGPPLDPPDPTQVVGTYHDPWNVGTWVFSMDDEDRLVMEMPLLDQLDIPYEPLVTPWVGNTFVIEVQGTPMELAFVHDEAGPRWARTRYFVAERESEADRRASGTPDVRRLLARLEGPEEPLPPPIRLQMRR